MAVQSTGIEIYKRWQYSIYTPMKCNKNLNLGKEIVWASFLPASTLIHTLKSIITQKDEIQNIGIIEQNVHYIRASFQKKLHVKASPLWYVVAELGPHSGRMYANTAEPTSRNVVLGIKISKLQRCSNGKNTSIRSQLQNTNISYQSKLDCSTDPYRMMTTTWN